MASTLSIVNRFYPNVTSVVDAKRNVTIEVTKKDTNSNAVKNHKECALAVACKRKGADAAIICIKVAYLIQGDKAVRYNLPESVSREIVSFDRNAGFREGTYHLTKIPPASQQRVTKRKRGPRTTGRNPVVMHKTEDVRQIMEVIK